MVKQCIMRMMVALGIWSTASAAQATDWAVFYGHQKDLEAFKPFKLLILDSHYHPNLNGLKQQGTTLLGYLSLAELRPMDADFPGAESLKLDQNRQWGSSVIDIRKDIWVERVLTELIPSLLAKGFDGIFLDTADTAVYLEQKEPRAHAGMSEQALKIIRAIRYHYPHIPIMLNRGYGILDEAAPYIDMALGESVISTYDFANKRYHMRSEEEVKWQTDKLMSAKERNPKLRIMTLDYWDPKDHEAMQKIASAERAKGFEPYISDIKLQHLIRLPGS